MTSNYRSITVTNGLSFFPKVIVPIIFDYYIQPYNIYAEYHYAAIDGDLQHILYLENYYKHQLFTNKIFPSNWSHLLHPMVSAVSAMNYEGRNGGKGLLIYQHIYNNYATIIKPNRLADRWHPVTSLDYALLKVNSQPLPSRWSHEISRIIDLLVKFPSFVLLPEIYDVINTQLLSNYMTHLMPEIDILTLILKDKRYRDLLMAKQYHQTRKTLDTIMYVIPKDCTIKMLGMILLCDFFDRPLPQRHYCRVDDCDSVIIDSEIYCDFHNPDVAKCRYIIPRGRHNRVRCNKILTKSNTNYCDHCQMVIDGIIVNDRIVDHSRGCTGSIGL